MAVRSLDELPLVAVLGAAAAGETVVAGAGELRAKESDRVGLASMHERAAEIGWELEVVTSPGAGTRLRVQKKPAGERQV